MARPRESTAAGSGAHFHRRDIAFGTDAPIPKFWLRSNCHLTRFFDAMSLLFPEGERAFIESVQLFRDRIGGDATLCADVSEFIAQEALHRREHIRYNRMLSRQGVPVDRLERNVIRQQELARRWLPPAVRLAITTCLEHFTAMMADRLLRDARCLDGAHPVMADLWLWHALEEAEHKAVAFDVFTVGVRGSVCRYALRCATMLVVTPVFWTLLWHTTLKLVRQDGEARNALGWLQLVREQFFSRGSFGWMVSQWTAWFRPGFHPWQHDNRNLIEMLGRQLDRRGAQGGSDSPRR